MDQLTKLADYGSVGTSIALIIALVYIVRYIVEKNERREERLSTLIGNHINHQTDAMTCLSVAIKELSTLIDTKLK